MNKRTGPVLSIAAGIGLAAVLAAHAAGGPRSLVPTSGGGTGTGTGTGTGAGTGSKGSGASSGGSPSTTTSPPSSNGQAPQSAASGTATGAVEQYGYGELSVKVSVVHGRIDQVVVTKLLTAESYSQQLADQVIPMLRNEVLSAQSAHISAISGATYTSEAYASSLQSALDQLHVQ